MNRDTSVGEFLDQLRREVDDRQLLIYALSERLDEPTKSPATTEAPTRVGVAQAAADILREAGRPMHGLHEILPALRARGFAPKSRAGFATLLLRTGKIIRTAPGTYAYKAPEPDALAS